MFAGYQSEVGPDVRAGEPVPFADLDREVEEAAASLGANNATIFFRVILPALAPALLSGAGLAFSRAIGEFGSIVLIGGAIPGELEKAIVAGVGSVDKMKEEFTQAGVTQFGSGWAWLIIGKDGKLIQAFGPRTEPLDEGGDHPVAGRRRRELAGELEDEQPVDPLAGEPYVPDDQAPMQPPSPQPSSPTSPKGGYRDAPNPQQPEGRPAPERKGDALFF